MFVLFLVSLRRKWSQTLVQVVDITLEVDIPPTDQMFQYRVAAVVTVKLQLVMMVAFLTQLYRLV